MRNLFESPSKQQLDLNLYARHQLEEIRKWAMFFAIAGLAALFIILAAIFGAALQLFSPETVSLPVRAMVLLIIAIGLFSLPGYFLLMYSRSLRQAFRNNDSMILARAFRYKKMYYRLAAILLIMMLICVFVFEFFLGELFLFRWLS